MHNGNSRRVGWIFASTSTRAARETAIGQCADDRCDTNSVRSFDAAGQHGGAPLRVVFGSGPRIRASSANGQIKTTEVTMAGYAIREGKAAADSETVMSLPRVFQVWVRRA